MYSIGSIEVFSIAQPKETVMCPLFQFPSINFKLNISNSGEIKAKGPGFQFHQIRGEIFVLLPSFDIIFSIDTESYD